MLTVSRLSWNLVRVGERERERRSQRGTRNELELLTPHADQALTYTQITRLVYIPSLLQLSTLFSFFYHVAVSDARGQNRS